MADNRMCLVCRGCGNALLLGKALGGEYHTFHNNMNMCLTIFYKDHSYCGDNIHPENQFSLSYETAHDEDVTEYELEIQKEGEK